MRTRSGHSNGAAAGAGLPPPAIVMLAALLVVDTMLMLGHILFVKFDIGGYFTMSLAASGGYAERVLQGKWLMIAVLFVALAALWRSWRPLPYAFLGFYFWFGDMTDLPIMLVRWVRTAVGSAVLDQERLFGVPTIEVLSSAVHAAVFLVFLVPAVLAWRTATAGQRRVMRRMAFAIIALGVFGVGIDVVSSSVLSPELKDSWGDLIEDGGELVIASFMLWIVCDELFRSRARE